MLYAGITVGAVAMYFTLESHAVGWVLIFMALNYVGVHGMLSGTASADFGGKKNAGVAVGIIDGSFRAWTRRRQALARILAAMDLGVHLISHDKTTGSSSAHARLRR